MRRGQSLNRRKSGGGGSICINGRTQTKSGQKEGGKVSIVSLELGDSKQNGPCFGRGGGGPSKGGGNKREKIKIENKKRDPRTRTRNRLRERGTPVLREVSVWAANVKKGKEKNRGPQVKKEKKEISPCLQWKKKRSLQGKRKKDHSWPPQTTPPLRRKEKGKGQGGNSGGKD